MDGYLVALLWFVGRITLQGTFFVKVKSSIIQMVLLFPSLQNCLSILATMIWSSLQVLNFAHLSLSELIRITTIHQTF